MKAVGTAPPGRQPRRVRLDQPRRAGRTIPGESAAAPVLAEQTDERAEGRRYLGLDILTRSRLTVTGETNQEADTTLALSA